MALQEVVARLEVAKEALAASVPGRRGPGVPLAQGIASFEAGLRSAQDAMPSWDVPEMHGEWIRCEAALDEAARRAESLRLEESPQGYEDLYGLLAGLMEPLEVFEEALSGLRDLRP
jgi:hypothetical protein